MSMFIFKEARHFQKKSDKTDLYVVNLLEIREKDGKQYVFERDNFVDKTVYEKIAAMQLMFGAIVKPIGQPADYFGGRERLGDLELIALSPYGKA